MEQIAARAHVSKGTLYNHFESREDLLLAMLEEQLQAGTEIVAAAVDPDANPARALDDQVDALIRVVGFQLQTAPLLYQAWTLVTEAPALERRFHEAMRRFFELWSESIRGTLEAGQASGDFRSDADIDAFTTALIAMVSGLIFRGCFDPQATEPRVLRAAFDALLDDRLRPESRTRPGEPQ